MQAPNDTQELRLVDMSVDQLTDYLKTNFEVDSFWAENMASAKLEAGEDWLHYFGLNPEIFAVMTNLGISALQGQRYEEAGKIFSFILRVSGGKSADGWHGLGLVRQRTMGLEMAAIAHSEAFAQDNSRLDAAQAWAECLMRTGRKEAAKRVLGLLVETGEVYVGSLAEQAAQPKKGGTAQKSAEVEQLMGAKRAEIAHARGLLAQDS